MSQSSPQDVPGADPLDRAVDAAYAADGGKRKWNSDGERVAFLFELYLRLTNLTES